MQAAGGIQSALTNALRPHVLQFSCEDYLHNRWARWFGGAQIRFCIRNANKVRCNMQGHVPLCVLHALLIKWLSGWCTSCWRSTPCEQNKANEQADFKSIGHGFLGFGAFVNCWVVLWSCVDAYVIIGACSNTKDLLFDALGLLFLYNLDDIGGELGFLGDNDWPGLQLAWIHQEIVPKAKDDPEWRIGDPRFFVTWKDGSTDWRGTIFLNLYRFTTGSLLLLLVFLPVLAALTPFSQIAPPG